MPDDTQTTDTPTPQLYTVFFKLMKWPHGQEQTGSIGVTATTKEAALAKARGLLTQKHQGDYLDYLSC